MNRAFPKVSLVARSLLLAACQAWTSDEPVATASVRRVKVDRPGLPLSELSDAELARFRQGDALFEATVRENDGLGPLYVRDACSACHVGDGRGPGVVSKVAPRSGDVQLAKSLLPFGSTVRPYVAAGAKIPLVPPDDARLMVTRRLPPAVFGRGYLEAIDDRDIERLAARAAVREGSARGRLHRLPDGTIGRFGLKARIATLEEFTADALSGDMGVSSPSRPEEPAGPEGLRDDAKPGVDFTAEQVSLMRDYLRGLRIPERRTLDERGRQLFVSVGCGDCHEPSFQTSSRYPIRALAGVRAEVYTDLLLHDMGEALSDGVHEAEAGPREFRTAPLIGLRFLPSLLHDGRAVNVREAVLAHGMPDSEGRDSVRAFQSLSPGEQRALINFVEAL